MHKHTTSPFNTLLIALCLAVGLPQMAAAGAQHGKTQALIQEILASEEFKTTEEVTEWRYIGEGDDWLAEDANDDWRWLDEVGPILKVIAQLFEIVLWAAAAFLLFMGIRYALYHFNWIAPPPKPDKPQFQPVFGEAVENLVLEGDIAAQAWQRWQQGEQLLALSLLYRGALQVLHERDGLHVKDSATENECLRLVRHSRDKALSAYFTDLTRVWLYAAYAHRLPNQAQVESLCSLWPQHFGTGE
jgi:hypothetical protein